MAARPPPHRGPLRAPGPIRHLEWNAGGLVAHYTGGARLWNRDGAVVADVADARAVAAENGGSRRLAVTAEHHLQIFDASGSLLHDIPTPGCNFVAWATGRPILCASPTGGPSMVDPDTGEVDSRMSLPRHRWYWASATGPHLALLDWDTHVYHLDAAGLRTSTTVPWANRVVPGPRGESVLLNGRGGIYRSRLDGSPPERVGRTSHRSTDYVVSPDGTTVAVADLTGGVHFWDLDTGDPRLERPGSAKAIQGIAWAPDGRQLAVGDASGVIRLLKLDALTADPGVLAAGVHAAWRGTGPQK